MPTRIPVIDISAFVDGTDPLRVAKEVDAACRDLGFFAVTGHGFDLDLLDAVRRVALDFFRMPLDRKKAGSEQTVMGYLPLADLSLAYSRGEVAPPDLHEGFGVGRPDLDLDDPYFTHPEIFPENAFPPEPAALRDLTIAYYRKMSDLCDSVMRLFALALGLPTNYFVPLADRPFSFFRIVYYPSLTDAPLPGQMRASAHTDYGTFTLVNFNEAPGGLQVQDRDGTWIDVPTVEGAFVCNIGDLFEIWTNDQWVSTLHRVVAPPIDQSDNSERLSLVYFHEPNWDTIVSPLPTCVDAAHPARHEPVAAGEHVQRKVKASRVNDPEAALTQSG